MKDRENWSFVPPPSRAYFEAAQQYGGVFNLSEDIDELLIDSQMHAARIGRFAAAPPYYWFNSILDQVSNYSHRLAALKGKLEFSFIYNREPNALCWVHKEKYFIGITSGLVQFALAFCNSLLSHREFMSGVFGGWDEEQGNRIDALRETLQPETLLNWEIEPNMVIGKFDVPRSAERRLFAVAMTHQILLYCFLHELGHIVYRHLDYNAEKFLQNEIGECWVNLNSSPGNKYLSHRFELLADDFATNVSLLSRLGRLNTGLDDASDFVTWSVATDLLLWIFGQKIAINQKIGSHPHPQIRIFAKQWGIMDQGNYGEPSLTSDQYQGNESIADIVVGSSLTLSEFWTVNRLPGWTNNPSQEPVKDKFWSAVEGLQHKHWEPRECWSEYEQFLGGDPTGEIYMACIKASQVGRE